MNALRIGICGGIETLVRMMDSAKTSVGSDQDAIRVQANAAEALVNCTRNDSHENAERIRRAGIKPIVLLCTSTNLAVQRSSALIPAGGKIRGSRHSLEGGYRDAIRSESRGTILQVFVGRNDRHNSIITKIISNIKIEITLLLPTS